jgi:hypothetical protein
MTELTEEQHRNKRLAERLASGNSVPSLDEVMETIRLNAGAYLDVPGPRAAQLCDEIDSLRAQLAAVREQMDKGSCSDCGGDPGLDHWRVCGLGEGAFGATARKPAAP